MQSNGYTVLTAAAIFIPLSISLPSIFEQTKPEIIKEIVVDVEALSSEEKKDYFLSLSYQTCLKEGVKVTPNGSGQVANISEACAESVKKLK
tara:strand:- start:1110 stop:1385 length:276 start_codon:yes stop_codon:yes gene_type:complete